MLCLLFGFVCEDDLRLPLKRTPPSYVVFVVTDVEKTGSTSKSGRFSGNAVTTRKVLVFLLLVPKRARVVFVTLSPSM